MKRMKRTFAVLRKPQTEVRKYLVYRKGSSIFQAKIPDSGVRARPIHLAAK